MEFQKLNKKKSQKNSKSPNKTIVQIKELTIDYPIATLRLHKRINYAACLGF
jgi:hypothetical protein